MCPSFRYDVAVSYVSEDALTARCLMDRLRPRLYTPILDATALAAADLCGAPAAPCSDARVVVILHQRLWGETSTTRRDRTMIEQRVARQGTGFLVVVPLEPRADLPAWATGTGGCTPLSANGVAEIDAIAAAVQRGGGLVQPAPAELMIAMDDDGTGAANESEAFRSSFKMATAAQREVTALIDEIEERADELKTRFPDLTVAVRRTPERCVVQAGAAALSVSWLRPSPSAQDHGTLLVIEWEGTVTFPGEPVERRRHALAVREHALHLAPALGPAGPAASTWNWSANEAPMRQYTSLDLASLCMQYITWQLGGRADEVTRSAQDVSTA